MSTLVRINGVTRSDARRANASIHEVLGPAANSARISLKGTAPSVGDTVTIVDTRESPERVLFAGEIQAVTEAYDLESVHPRYDCDLIDPSFKANRRRPFGTWVQTSASVIDTAIATSYAPGCTRAGIVAGLPAIDIAFDGSEPFMACRQRIANAVGSGCRATISYANDLGLFLTDTGEAPDPIDNTHRPLNDPPIAFTIDLAQVRTRVYGKGYTGTLQADVKAQETILPIAAADAVMFNPAGGQAIAGTTAGGAQSEILTYTGVQLGGGGSLVGPGAAPAVAPTGRTAVGTGVESGVHGYAYTDVTAAGESLPSPLASVTVGFLANPATVPTVVASAGSGIEDGVHQYAYSDVTAAGETLPSPLASVTHAPGQAAPNSIGAAFNYGFGSGNLQAGQTYLFGYTFRRTSDGVETTLSPTTSIVTDSHGLVGIPLSGCQAAPAGWTRKWYHSAAGGGTLKADPTANELNNFGTEAGNWCLDASLGSAAPTTNGTAVNRSSLSAIAVGPTGTTARKVWRTVAGGSQLKLLTTIADNTTTTYTDSTADGSLGANAPTSNTAAANQVVVSSIATGSATVTSRKVYRTAAGGSQLKLLTTIADNTTTTYTDSTADASLGANVPTSDTSGLTQPSGQVNAGSTSLPTASAGPFASSGGWALTTGGQAVRYTGITGNTLTGIPATGPGALLTTVVYGSQILPASALTGVDLGFSPDGIPVALAKGATIAIWVQRDDVPAQAALAALEGGDGIHEDTLFDGRFGEDLLVQACDARLAQFRTAPVGVQYATLDVKTRCGATVAVNLSAGFYDPAFYDPAFYDAWTYGVVASFTIQDVTKTFIGAAGVPRFDVQAGSVAFTMQDLLRLVPIG